jgi:hypothetical protein
MAKASWERNLCPLKKGKMGAEIKNEYINEHVLKQ